MFLLNCVIRPFFKILEMRNAIEAASGKEQSLLSDLAEKATNTKALLMTRLLGHYGIKLPYVQEK